MAVKQTLTIAASSNVSFLRLVPYATFVFQKNNPPLYVGSGSSEASIVNNGIPEKVSRSFITFLQIHKPNILIIVFT